MTLDELVKAGCELPAWTTPPPTSFATTLVGGKTDLVLVAEMMGHVRLETTRRNPGGEPAGWLG